MLAIACRQPPPVPDAPLARRNEPTLRGTVVTIQTTLQPANRVTTHELIIAGNKARSTEEEYQWRLFDLGARTVTFVNDVEKTWRSESIDSVFADRRAASRRPIDRDLPVAQFQATGAERQILDLPATQALVRLGGYQRELWFARHPQIPDELFAMMHGTAEPGTRLGAIVAASDPALLAMRGYPLVDRAELPFGRTNMVVERVVTMVDERHVDSELIGIPGDYREVKAPAVSRPPVSSRPPGQTTPATGSLPSATTRTTP
jgi:hypothetical protein